jgi:hypothetical protein
MGRSFRRLLPFLLLLLALPAMMHAQFSFTTNNGTITITGYAGPDANVTIPSSTNGWLVTSIGDYAFYNGWSLTSVTIPSSVTNIGEGAFGGCTSLTAITVDTNNPDYSSVAGVLFGKNQTILIQYPLGNTGTSYTIPNSVINIANDAFSNNDYLSSVTIGPNVTTIGNGAFENLSSLTNITIPGTVTRIGNAAFFSCANLALVKILGSVNSIGNFAFESCMNLTGVYFAGNAPILGAAVFGDTLVSGSYDTNAVVYYLPGTIGWDTTFGGISTTSWLLPNPLILDGPSFGVQANAFGFIISWATNIPVVVEACTNLGNPTWYPLQTNTLTNGSSYFSDPQWTNYPARFYRLMPAANLVLNGGFETGDFTAWTLSGSDTKDDFVAGGADGLLPHSGRYLTQLGSTNALGYLSQSLTTIAGAHYLLSLWLDSPDGQTPNAFQVRWNETTLFDEMNIPAIGWTNLQFLVSATGTSTFLEFGFRDDPAFLGLDDVSVLPVPLPNVVGVSVSQANLVIQGANGISGLTYYLLTSTDLALPKNQWTPVVTNTWHADGSFSLTLTNAVDRSFQGQFYILLVP